jgi:D-alanyl-D-alanine carboxypeptidase
VKKVKLALILAALIAANIITVSAAGDKLLQPPKPSQVESPNETAASRTHQPNDAANPISIDTPSKLPSGATNPISNDTPSKTPGGIAKETAQTQQPAQSVAQQPNQRPQNTAAAAKAASPSGKGRSEHEKSVQQPAKPDRKPQLSVPASVTANALDQTIAITKQGLAIVTNKASTLVVVNKNRNLPSTYTPNDLVVPNVMFSFAGNSPKKQMREVAADALEELFAQAKRDKIDIKAVSGYRSYATQKSIFDRNARVKGTKEANKTSAYPGQSEHQTGLAMDISSASVGYDLVQSYGKTKEGKWLAANAPKYGFIIRYGKGKESITGYSYEPWHVRYVGKSVAKEIAERGITLEDYFKQAV